MLSNTITPKLVKKFVPVRKLSSRKGDNGKVLVLGGSYIYHGAPALASLAALRTGADLVAAALVKYTVYGMLAFSIVFLCPVLFEKIGMPCETTYRNGLQPVSASTLFLFRK